jgi:hypothetical protein
MPTFLRKEEERQYCHQQQLLHTNSKIIRS